jgi:uncharacterized membrane protein YebE (DUF533 family)
MANLQRLLGTMLASRMAGRGGMGGALGGAAMMGLGGPLLRSKAGLAALGYLAYRSYRQNQNQNQPSAGTQTQTASAGGTQAGLGGMIGGFIDSLSGGQRRTESGGPSLGERIGSALNPGSREPRASGPDSAPGPATVEQGAAVPEPEATVSDQKALLLIRAMIAAANSDGQITPDERARICARVEEAGADAEDKRLIGQELDNPRSLDSLLKEVTDRETAQQFYFASRAAVEGATPTQQSYLAYLRQRLDLPEDDVDAVEQMATGR